VELSDTLLISFCTLMCFLCVLWAQQRFQTAKGKLPPRDWCSPGYSVGVWTLWKSQDTELSTGSSQPLPLPWGAGWLNPIRVAGRFGSLALPGRLWRSLSTKLKSQSCVKQDALLLPQGWALLIAVAEAELEAVEESPGTTPIVLYKDVRKYKENFRHCRKILSECWSSVQIHTGKSA